MAPTEPVCRMAMPLPTLDPQAYSRWRASEIGAITERIERKLMLEAIGDVHGLHVLEIGCGDGSLAVELSRRGAHVSAIDASPAMIAAARQRADRHDAPISFAVATAQELPFPPARFDLVVAQTVLCFVASASPVFREISRVLRPGARLVIGELGKWSTWAAARRIRSWLGSPLWRMGHFRTPRELETLAREAGLVPEAVRGGVYYPRVRLAARLMERLEPGISRLTTFGAAFLVLSAYKPNPSSR